MLSAPLPVIENPDRWGTTKECAMIRKTFLQADGKMVARITFMLPHSIWADKIYLVGDFNNWDCNSHPFWQDREGNWTLTLDLEVGRAYQYRYRRECGGWLNDYRADAYVHDHNGSYNFVVITAPNYGRQ
jgi:1,4-alpha-glucan branching enzyme